MDKLLEKLKNKQRMTVKEIRDLFRQRNKWQEDLYYPLAKCALDMGENFYAYDIAEKIPEEKNTPNLPKIHIMALALARSGSLMRAAELLDRLPETDDSEIVGLKSRIVKDMAINTVNPDSKRELFQKAADLSLDVFRKKKQYYNGINAASCLFMANQKTTAQRLIKESILPICEKESVHDLWWEATMGECFLLLENFDISALHYKKAIDLAVNNGLLGSIASTLKQLYMLTEKFRSTDVEKIEKLLNLPGVAVFSGHMIDRPDRKTPRFPAYTEDQVRMELAAIIQKQNIHIAYVSCACGGDIIFIEEMLKNGGECFILPPLPLEQTIKNSVDIIPGADWKARLENILQHKNTVLLDAECDEIGEESDSVVYDFANRFLLGAAVMKARDLHFPLYGISVWNLEKSGLPGGTDSAISLWKGKKIPIEIVTPEVKND